MPISNDSIKLLKLVSGEELIGEVTTNLSSSCISIKYPLSTMPTHDGSIVFVPFCATADTISVNIFKEKLLCEPLPVQDAICDEYRRIVEPSEAKEELTVPKKDLILPKK